MVLKINPVMQSLGESATLAINQLAIKLRSQGENIAHFGFGESPFPVPEAIQQALRNSVQHKQYLPTRGLPALRSRFANYYNSMYQTQLLEENVFVGPGSKELIFQLLFLLDGPVIIPAPSWVSYLSQAKILNKRVITPITSSANAYKLSAEQLESVCMDNPGEQLTLILNSPNNPTGSVYSKLELVALTDICRTYGVVLISDEIYALVDFDAGFCSPAHVYPEGTIVSTGLSKGFSAGGYRLGVIALPEVMAELDSALCTLISETFSCVSTPVQHAALAAYVQNTPQDQYTSACMQIHRLAGYYLYKRFTDMGLHCVKPEGAFYLFPDFESFRDKLVASNIHGSIELCNLLLEEHGVAALPGTAFYMPEQSLTVRIASVDYDGAAAVAARLEGQELDEKFVGTYLPNLILGADRIEQVLRTL